MVWGVVPVFGPNSDGLSDDLGYDVRHSAVAAETLHRSICDTRSCRGVRSAGSRLATEVHKPSKSGPHRRRQLDICAVTRADWRVSLRLPTVAGASLKGHEHQLCPVRGLDLKQHVRNVVAHSLGCEPQVFANLRIGVTPREELQDVVFPS